MKIHIFHFSHLRDDLTIFSIVRDKVDDVDDADNDVTTVNNDDDDVDVNVGKKSQIPR